MYTLYYLNRNHQLGTISVSSMDEPILIPEDLVFCNFRSGVKFIKEPHECIGFNDMERLIMASEFTDIELLKHYDYRRQNTYLQASCTIEQADKDPRASCCDDVQEPELPTDPEPVYKNVYAYYGTRICQDGATRINTIASFNYKILESSDKFAIGTRYLNEDLTPVSETFLYVTSGDMLLVLENGYVNEAIPFGSPCVSNRFLTEVQVSNYGLAPMTLQFVKADGTAVQHVFTPSGSPTATFYFSYGVGECIRENSLYLDIGDIIDTVWDDNISCPL
ncbi:hypothetical protein IR010_00685 [Flavobacterium sp. MR2016-29]|uniref:hypothetical protein n=1 Tax=Flavobacterium sp. MR2016-29 TaxID=2783795 RepID=UPI00188ADC32|nr:hypothetical protein [Flavobacterium sp. MR2016-29]MBF4491038.1 hypothetical protein [Flavobacterium sp. MR2016-29]